jgi:hypothetical protein
MLWLYGADDLFYGDESVKRYASAFAQAGGVVNFRLIAGIPENPEKWRPYVDRFLPAAKR